MSKRFGLLFTGAIAFVILMLSGCPGDGKVSVSGKVTVDSVIVESGSIAFAPTDGKTSVEGAEIKDGKYSARVPPGDKIVRIRGMKLQPSEVYDAVSKTTHASSTAIRITDAKYEAEKSPLQVTITKNGEKHDFDLPAMNQEK
ncbi:MAG: hypothetical protein FWH27_11000 [Planctomycetaceae bacterium]|nr:hypothetical protein [Planctomycetaceae bacterium]